MAGRSLVLNFASGRRKRVVESRYDLACRIATAPTGEWARLNPDEADASRSLEAWGMILRDSKDASYVQWSYLHERPVFRDRRYSVFVNGVEVHRLSFEQRVLMLAAIQARDKPHRVLMRDGILARRRLQRMIRALEQRGLMSVDRQPDAWAISIVRPANKPT